MELRFLGHSAFALSDGGTTVLVDPFLTGNPRAAASADELDATTILLTHGHADHLGDTVAIAKRTGATVVAIGDWQAGTPTLVVTWEDEDGDQQVWRRVLP